MTANDHNHVSEKFARLLDLFRRSDGSEWGGPDRANFDYERANYKVDPDSGDTFDR